MARDSGFNTVTTIASERIGGSPTGFAVDMEAVTDWPEGDDGLYLGLVVPTGYDGSENRETRVVAPWDSLTAPENDELITPALSFWPQGAAWGTPDGEAMPLSTTLAKFTRVLLSPFIDLYARAYALVSESTVQGISVTLDQWEADYGLPGPCGVGNGTTAERLRELETKLLSAAVITPGDFIALAKTYGFEITIEEPAVFECGFSECGGEHELGPLSEERYWFVTVRNLAVDYFRVGESQLGSDPLFSLGAAERLLCMLKQFAPAWSIPVLATESEE
ncbi:DUF2313 domain-containing protein [Martelella sp. HB161492]|uniref:DUF2313 domain-containing protein n=1 Tax=Martelella sp. HB161492 TaxID=2720726 RepID=UPI001591C987|nr:DUF2313 domain-containing protein [Martelella sp. HB161492]